MACVHLH